MLTATFSLGCAALAADSPRDPFLDRHGTTFLLTIDGEPVQPMRELEVGDVAGMHEARVRWSAATKGKPCFILEPNNPGLGAFRGINIQLKEINLDRPIGRWRNFLPVPNPESPTGEQVWIPGKPYCPTEYILTHRLRFKELPEGSYVVRVQYDGTRNWDVKEILLEVKRSTVKEPEFHNH